METETTTQDSNAAQELSPRVLRILALQPLRADAPFTPERGPSSEVRDE
jgi:hypothetical protein